jgi:phage FluMu protein Com
MKADIRCAGCRALLFRADSAAIAGEIEIKCRRCGQYNCLRPLSPFEIADRVTDRSLPCGSICQLRA